MFKKINLFDSIVIGLIIISFILFVLYPFVAVFNYGYKGELFSELLANLPSYSHLLLNTVKVASATTIGGCFTLLFYRNIEVQEDNSVYFYDFYDFTAFCDFIIIYKFIWKTWLNKL